MIFTIMKCLLSVLLAVGGGLLGSRWIATSYRRAKGTEGLLSFPERIEEQEKKRPGLFAVCIGFLFCFTMLELPYVHLTKLVFLMIFQYFMAQLVAIHRLPSSRWIATSYRRAKGTEGLLSFPERIEEQEKKRPGLFAVCIGFLFCFTMLELPYVHLTKLVFLMIFQYFMALYTWTDLEQRVIFDRMLIPFAVIGLISIPLLDRVLTDHLMAAAVGGVVFLALAVLTKGGIGGGDIKLVAALGLWLGSDMLMTVVIAGIVLGGMAALIMLATGKRKKGDYFAYGPYFTISALLFTLL